VISLNEILANLRSFLGIDVDGVHQHDIITQIGNRYDIHALVQTDITTTEQRTKLDVLDDALFLVCKLIFRDIGRSGHTVIEQISFYLKENILITFQETPKDLFDSIKSNKKETVFIKYLVCFFLLSKIVFDKEKVVYENVKLIIYFIHLLMLLLIIIWMYLMPWAQKLNQLIIN
jgi:Mg2+ and Co2+ transporter CorA